MEVFGRDPLGKDSGGNGIADAMELLFPPTSTCPGDLNGDQAVTVSDLLLLLAQIGVGC